MGKYDRLAEHLRDERRAEFTMSFHQIERIIGAALPNTAANPLWWTGEDKATGKVQLRAWRNAGYRARLHAGRKVRFSKLKDQ